MTTNLKVIGVVSGVLGAAAALSSFVVDFRSLFVGSATVEERSVSTSGNQSPVVIGAGRDVTIGK